MKTVRQICTRNALSMMKSNRLFVGMCLTGTLLLTGCQSTSLGQSKMVATTQSPDAAKKTLEAALKKQRRQSFSYHSNLEISNQKPLADIKDKPLVASDYVDEYCEATHDQAYAALIAQAESQNTDIMATSYEAKRTAIKQSYLECEEAYHIWSEHQYDEGVTVAPRYQALFDHHDDYAKPLDMKKAALLDEYLLKPLSIDAQGIYQPMAGKATMLASVQYKARNHHSSVNQPVYVDFKNGDIYLWADNFAMFNSELVDDKLGTKWRNKWLKITIDDGTLPKGFGSALIKTHFAALDLTYDAAPTSQFEYVDPSRLATLSPKLPKHHLPTMQDSSQIIRRVQSLGEYEDAYQNYMQIFYDRISQQYPELVINDKSEREERMNQEAAVFTSKAMVQKILVMIKHQLGNDRGADYKAATQTEVQELYGLDKRGQLQWQQIHRKLARFSQEAADTGMTVDVLQQYAPLNSKHVAFPNLPSNVQSPNASNSIDLREYGPELLQYYRDGNGTAIGQMIFKMLPMAKAQFGRIE